MKLKKHERLNSTTRFKKVMQTIATMGIVSREPTPSDNRWRLTAYAERSSIVAEV